MEKTCNENEDISVLLLDSYYLDLNFYKKQLNLLKKHKPFFFQKTKLKKYKEEKIELEKKIKKSEGKIRKYFNGIEKHIKNNDF